MSVEATFENDRQRDYSLNLWSIYLFCLDLVLGFASMYLAFLLRFDLDIPSDKLSIYFYILPHIFVFRSISHFYFKIYSRLWEYANLHDFLKIFFSCAIGSFLIGFSIWSNFANQEFIKVPLAVLAMDLMLITVFQTGARVSWKSWRSYKKTQKKRQSPRAFSTNVFISGNDPRGNSTSTTGPAIASTLPSLVSVLSSVMVIFTPEVSGVGTVSCEGCKRTLN